MRINDKIKVLAYAVSLAFGSPLLATNALAVETNAEVATATTSALTTNTRSTLDSGSTSPRKVSPNVQERILNFNDLGYSGSILMQGSESQVYVGFGSRLDEITSKATLSLDFIPSPALLSVVSHMKVYFNNELMSVISIADGTQGKKVQASIPLDPRLFSNYNQLRFEMIGDIDQLCRDPNHASIWAEISQNSHIALQVQKTQIANDLSLLPAPFFDQRDMTSLVLPMVIGDNADIDEIKALGIASSYFGSLAEWRKTSFPVLQDEAPDDHAIVFVTNDNKPEFLKDYPDVDGPYLQMISHPSKPYVKLLVVSGRDNKDLIKAVKGLAFGQHLLTGPIAKVTRIQQIKPRKPYDAPNWINTERPVTLAEMVKDLNRLQIEGQTPPPVTVDFQLPPDLFTWQSNGIPFELGYRYSPQNDTSGSRMSLSINNQFIKAFPLTSEGESQHAERLRIPLLDDASLSDRGEVHIPAFKVGSRNNLKFEFGFSSPTSGGALKDGALTCQSTQPSKQYAAIDANSYVDFSGFAHYIQMPNMRSFANSGFPFTRMADLSDTVIVLPEQPTQGEIETFADMMGRFAANTGYPAVNIELTNKWSKETLQDKDILTIGIEQNLKEVSENYSPNMLLNDELRLSQLPSKNENQQGKNWVSPTTSEPQPADLVEISAKGNFAAITSYQSPFSPQRTVVNILANSAPALNLVNEALNDTSKVGSMFGSVITIRDNSIASFNVGEHYYVGHLPVWQLVMYHFSQYPILMSFAALLLVILVTLALWRVLRRIARSRIEDTE